jgi:hypothetical protein
MDDSTEMEDLIRASLAELEKTSLWKAYIELQAIELILADDVSITGSTEKDDGNRQFWRRTAMRSVFALIEGVVYRMKQLAFEVHEYDGMPLSRAEAAILLEESYELNEKGVATIKQNYPKIEKNIKFAFATLGRAYNVPYQLHLGDEVGWGAFIKTLKVRNRLTHPKHVVDLTVSDEEITTMMNAYYWFLASVKALLDEIGAALNFRALELEKIARGDSDPHV